MSILNKIKYNYLVKLIDDHVASNDISALRNLFISNCSKNNQLFSELLKYFCSKFKKNVVHDLHDRKIIWLVSFDKNDFRYIENFLNFYLDKNFLNKFLIQDYDFILAETLSSLKDQKETTISVDDFLNNSLFYQNLVLFHKRDHYKILTTNSAFFEYQKINHFCNSSTTSSFIHLLRSPYEIFLKNKNNTNSSEQALNNLFNYDERPYLNSLNNGYRVETLRKSWQVNTNSWLDPNVKSAFNGKLIKHENLISNTSDVLSEIVIHLKEVGLDLEINYDDINNFILNNKFEEIELGTISKKDQKLIDRNISNLIY